MPRVLDAYRRGLIEIDDLGEHIEKSRRELEPLQEELAGLINLEAHKGKMVGELTNAAERSQFNGQIGPPLWSKWTRQVSRHSRLVNVAFERLAGILWQNQ